jgi:hypothetical protein
MIPYLNAWTLVGCTEVGIHINGSYIHEPVLSLKMISEFSIDDSYSKVYRHLKITDQNIFYVSGIDR